MLWALCLLSSDNQIGYKLHKRDENYFLAIPLTTNKLIELKGKVVPGA